MEILNDVLSDVANLALVVFGFTATLFTVLYSFIVNKRDNLREFSDKIKSGVKDPIIGQRKSNIIKYINNLRTVNIQLIFSLFFSLIIYISSMIVKYLINEEVIKLYITWTIGILTFILLIHILYILIITVINYLKETKI